MNTKATARLPGNFTLFIKQVAVIRNTKNKKCVRLRTTSTKRGRKDREFLFWTSSTSESPAQDYANEVNAEFGV